jgi:antitoxin component YwqK of YwqJK toxin-antitoxin module
MSLRQITSVILPHFIPYEDMMSYLLCFRVESYTLEAVKRRFLMEVADKYSYVISSYPNGYIDNILKVDDTDSYEVSHVVRLEEKKSGPQTKTTYHMLYIDVEETYAIPHGRRRVMCGETIIFDGMYIASLAHGKHFIKCIGDTPLMFVFYCDHINARPDRTLETMIDYNLGEIKSIVQSHIFTDEEQIRLATVSKAIKMISFYKDGLRDGKFILLHDPPFHTKKKIEAEYSKGKLHGALNAWLSSKSGGSIDTITSCNYVDGKLHGSYTEWFYKTSKRGVYIQVTKCKFNNGEIDGQLVVLQGTDISHLRTVVECALENGRMHGLYRDYHLSGNIRSECMFDQGVLNGPCSSWFEDGDIKSMSIVNNDRLESYREWYSKTKKEMGQSCNVIIDKLQCNKIPHVNITNYVDIEYERICNSYNITDDSRFR